VSTVNEGRSKAREKCAGARDTMQESKLTLHVLKQRLQLHQRLGQTVAARAAFITYYHECGYTDIILVKEISEVNLSIIRSSRKTYRKIILNSKAHPLD
jgi:hypothetical protein